MVRIKVQIALLAVVIGLTIPNPAWSGEAGVPLVLQVQLCSKLLAYVQEPPLRQANPLHIGIVVKPHNAESERVGAELKAGFDRLSEIAGRPHEQTIVPLTSAGALVEEFKRQDVMVVYLTPGVDADMAPIASALLGLPILTITAKDSLVDGGALLGFEIVSGHPKMIFNARQAKKQGVVLRAAAMALMRIVE